MSTEEPMRCECCGRVIPDGERWATDDEGVIRVCSNCYGPEDVIDTEPEEGEEWKR